MNKTIGEIFKRNEKSLIICFLSIHKGSIQYLHFIAVMKKNIHIR